MAKRQKPKAKSVEVLNPREVEIVNPKYQPSKAELEEDMRVKASFTDAIKALVQPVKIRYIRRPK